MFGRSRNNINLLELVPTRCFGHSVNDDGIVVVDMPRFHVKWMQEHLVPKSKYPFIRISLDPFGSFVWLSIDGQRTVADIIDACVQQFGDEIQPVHERMGKFIHMLRSRGFITIRGADGQEVR